MSEPPPFNSIPVQSLGYSMPAPSRPGIITAIGVISIIISCLSVLYSLGMGVYALAFYAMSQASAAITAASATTAPTAPSAVAATPLPAQNPAPSGSTIESAQKAANRRTMTAALSDLETLSSARRKQLDLLIASAEPQLLSDESPLTPANAQAMVTNHGQTPGATEDAPGHQFFEIPQGRIEVYDDHAVFFPADGSDTVRTGANTTSDDDSTTQPADTTAKTNLTPAEIQAVINQAQSASKNTLNPAQIACLQNLLSAPNQSLATPGVKAPAVISATVQPNGSAMIQFYNGMVSMSRTGKVLYQFSNSTGIASGGFSRSGPMFRVSPAACALVGFEALVSFGLAIFLFVSGILVMRQSPSGRRLHLIYATLKIPASIIGGVGMWWMMSSLVSGMMTGLGGSPAPRGVASVFMIGGLIMTAIACAYPIALLIALNARTVRDYYNSASAY